MIFLVIQWILLIVKVSEGITDTCPSTAIIPSTRVVRMCQPESAVEDVEDGNDNFDSVYFSLTERENNCSCIVSIKNVTQSTTLIIKRYNTPTVQPLCGMEIDVYQLRPTETVLIPDPIPTRCNSSSQAERFSYHANENPQLMFVSRIVDGNYARGYCIQIIRVQGNNGKDGSYLEISCGNQKITTPKATYTTVNTGTTLNDVTTSGQFTSISSSPTSMIYKSHINDITDAGGDSTPYIAVGAGAGIVIFVSLLVVILVCKRKNSNPSSKGETSANGRAATATDVDDDNDGLKYNVLYVSSEQHEDIDAHYSTADNAMPRHAIGDDEVCYSTVDDNNKFQISNLHKYQVTDAALEINEENGVKHYNAPTESGCVYAVVDKTQNSNNSVKNVETGATYAVVNKNKLRHSNEGDE